jgi:uroporphyrinogen-III synthase
MATQSRLPAFLLTRPAAQSQRFAAQLRQRFDPDIACIISPLLAPQFLEPAFPQDQVGALVFTSETGVAGFVAHRNRPVTLPIRAFCVGDRTATAAAQAGLEPVSADGDAAALIELIHQRQPTGLLLHICGAQTRGDVAQQLTDAGLTTTACVLYEQVAQALSPEALSLLQGTGAVAAPLFSPRSAALFCQQAVALSGLAPLTCFALSKAVAAELARLDGATLVCAEKPTAAALIAAIAECYAAA